jgi:hypothetical protein
MRPVDLAEQTVLIVMNGRMGLCPTLAQSTYDEFLILNVPCTVQTNDGNY